MQANPTHKRYGICKNPAKNDSLKKKNIITATSIKRTIATTSAFLMLCSVKKDFVQYRLSAS